MRVFCEVLFVDAADSEKFGKCAEYLWTEIEIPCVVPVGSTLNLPTPKEWEPQCGALLSEITRWDVTGGVLSCTAKPIGFTTDAEGIADLMSIGYTKDEPKVLDAAYRSILR